MGGEHITSMTPCFTLSIGVFPPTNKAQANKYFFLNTNFFFLAKNFSFCMCICVYSLYRISGDHTGFPTAIHLFIFK